MFRLQKLGLLMMCELCAGPNGTYHGFAGRDASRAFVTGVCVGRSAASAQVGLP